MTTPQNMATKPNRLLEEKSPYLLQHAYNPVDWYAWGEKPFAAARRENKPVFLSIGYSTCHWCHVMEKESFENEAIAEILNRHFISIKVDREERPDIDQLYMMATQAMTGGGGWPMSVFLFPDKKPFYAGTYFPPEPRLNHPGFPELLNSIIRAWRENRDALAESAEKVTTYLENSSNIAPADSQNSTWAENGYQALLESYDQMFYGFGTANKFPRPSCLSFLHTYARRAKDKKAFTMARQTLQAMALGGMYDHIGGGFHRYSVDRQWRIPHFEKMLYDQAQLVISYLEMYQQTEDDFFAEVAEETLDYVLRDLHHPGGGLYSAEDADSINPYDESKHGEGAFYLWKESEIREVLTSEDADFFITCYNIRQNGNALEDPAGDFTGRNILYREKTLAEMANASDNSAEELRSQLAACKKALLQRRNHRPRPHLDDKIITAWNGLMISALALAGRILGSSRYIAEAERIAQFLMDNLMSGTTLLRRWRDGEARFDGVLEDYAFVIQGMLDLHEATHRANYLTTAIGLTEKQITLFADPSGGFFGSLESSDLPARMKETYDGAEPSGNSVSALNLLRLGRRLNKPEWIEMAAQTIRSFGKVLEAQGLAMPMMLKALLLSQEAPAQLVIAGRRGEEDTEAMLACVNTFFLPQLQIVLADGKDNGEMLAEIYDFYHGIEKIEGKATAYLCKDFSCGTPTNSPVQLVEQLKQLRQKPAGE